jgi:hypothetical protein
MSDRLIRITIRLIGLAAKKVTATPIVFKRRSGQLAPLNVHLSTSLCCFLRHSSSSMIPCWSCCEHCSSKSLRWRCAELPARFDERWQAIIGLLAAVHAASKPLCYKMWKKDGGRRSMSSQWRYCRSRAAGSISDTLQ